MLTTILAALALQQTPEDSFRQMRAAEDLEVRLFAREPQLYNPACIDVDPQGRVWVAEAVNYRRNAGPRGPGMQPPYFPAPARRTGDRIVILEDTDGDGACDKTRVFYEGLDLQAPLGIAVIGDKVWISQAPHLFTIEIKPDGSAGRKEIVLSGFEGLNGDHSIHSSFVGPDGKFYHCLGDNGGKVTFPDGRRLVTHGKPFYGGCIFRTNLDLTGLEMLSWNYRNQVECAVDSFGTVFTSDNDHDGTQWVRFVYAMEGGDFGWVGPRGSHWHMEFPGVVPILMRTGAGSPAGMCIYEGKLLPERYRGFPIHAESGPGLVQSFRMVPDGAAWRVEGAATDADGRQTIETLSQIRKPAIMLSCADRWFRPSDVCVAPDGSVLVADWYDPVVGGGGMGHADSGRIYRIVPKGHDGSYRVSSPKTLVEALASPCISTRALAILRVREIGVEGLAPLAKSEERVLRARALFMLGTLGPGGQGVVREALSDPDPDFRVLAIRSLQQNGGDMAAVSRKLARDPSPHVRRELLLARAAPLEVLVDLAVQYDGHDRFYLEAVAIGARGREKELVEALKERWKGDWDRSVGGLLWALRRPEAVEIAAAAASAQRLDALDVLGTFPDERAGQAVARLLSMKATVAFIDRALSILERNLQGNWRAMAESRELRAAVEPLRSSAEHREAAERVWTLLGTRPLVQWKVSKSFPSPNCAGFDKPFPPEEAAEPEKLTDWWDVLQRADGQVDLRTSVEPSSHCVAYGYLLLRSFETFETRLLLGSDDGVKVWVNGKLVHSKHQHGFQPPRADAIPIRLVEGVNRILLKTDNRAGAWAFLLEIEDPGRKTVEVTRPPERRGFSLPNRLDPAKLPSTAEILKHSGDPANGRAVFFQSKASCASCHRVKGHGGEGNVGPDLSAIGTKLGKEGLLLSILKPSDAVAPEFKPWIVKTESRGTVTGVWQEENEERLVLRDPEGQRIVVPKSDIQGRKQSDLSSMPDDLIRELSLQELADLLEFLSALK